MESHVALNNVPTDPTCDASVDITRRMHLDLPNVPGDEEDIC